MDGHELKALIDEVRHHRLSRRGFISRMAAFGLTAPAATQLLALGGVAHAQSASRYKPTKAGGGGTLKLLWWQGPTLLNPHFAVGTKDQDGSRMFYEPLAAWDSKGNLQPILAAELPSRENGGPAADGKSVTWKLKQGVKWHDGQPFTADDVRVQLAVCARPGHRGGHRRQLQHVTVEKVDDHTDPRAVRDAAAVLGRRLRRHHGMIIPKHLFDDFSGAKSREAPTNLTPVGTGPYMFKEFRPGDLVTGVINTNYHEPNRPYFDAIEMKGGGDAASAARAVLQTGEYDLAWNLQVEDEVLTRLEAAGKGRSASRPRGELEHIQLNFTDPNVEVDGERSSIKTKHPTLTDPAVRQALSLLVDTRVGAQIHLRPRRRRDAQLHLQPGALRSPNTKYEFNVDKAIAILDKAGWKPGSGRHPRQGRQVAEIRVPDLDQPAAAEDAADRQAGVPEGRDRHRDQVGRLVGVLLLRRRQPGHLSAFLRRPADVHDRPDAAGSGAVPAALPRRPRRRRNPTNGRAATSPAGRTRRFDALSGQGWSSSTRSSGPG